MKVANNTTPESSIMYKCPYEKNCTARKHCHILETTERLPTKVTVIIKCPIAHKKISVVIGT